eukprot:TRINITY_DN12659_c0_g1_i1.p1 TRINITY_DN12659_c0_g1~~TRINITY_DN12659_c0_g1_i1.p1  ORF type:complete len:521 (-),score=115.21 TRINITY_DN12659_c0_g1_i1:8-1570(-)
MGKTKNPKPIPPRWETTTTSFWWDSLTEDEKQFASETFRLSSYLMSKKQDVVESETVFDVVIIGAGLTGVSTAYWLQELDPSLKIAIFEARAIAGGATGRNGGHCWPYYDEEDEEEYSDEEEMTEDEAKEYQQELKKSILWRFECSQIFEKFVREKLMAERGVDCQWFTTGGIYLVTKEDEMKECAEEMIRQQTEYNNYGDFSLWRKQDENPASHEMGQFLAREKEYLPLFHEAIGGFHQKAAGQYWPARATIAIAKLVKERNPQNVHIFTHALVASFKTLKSHNTSLLVEPEDSDICGMKFRVETKHVVHATNAYSNALLRGLIGVITPARGQVIASSPIMTESEHGKVPLILTPCSISMNEGWEYAIQRRADGRIVMGGMRWHSSVKEQEVGIFDDSKVDPQISTGLREKFRQSYVPESHKDATITHEWTGVMGCTCDGQPLIGRFPDKLLDPPQKGSNQWIAAGYGGNGMVQCFGAGKEIAEMVTGRKNKPDISLFDPERFADSDYLNQYKGRVEFE